MLISFKECVNRYGNHHKIARMVAYGTLKKIKPGIYSANSDNPSDIEIIQMRFPHSVLTLQSAFLHYGLSDHIPETHHLAVERNGSSIRHPAVTQHHVPNGTIQTGMIVQSVFGSQLRIFNLERLLVETVRNRTKLQADLYREVILNYRRLTPKLYPAKIFDYLESFPRKNAIERIIRSEVF